MMLTLHRLVCILAAILALAIAQHPAQAKPGPRPAPAPRPGPRPAPVPHAPWSPSPTGYLSVVRRTNTASVLLERQSSPLSSSLSGAGTLQASEPGGPLQPHSSGVSDSYADKLLPEPLAACYNTNGTAKQSGAIDKTSPLGAHCPERPEIGGETGDVAPAPSKSQSAPPPAAGQSSPAPSPLPNANPTKTGTDPTSASALGPTAPLPAPTPGLDQPSPTTPPSGTGSGAANTTMPSPAPNAPVAGTSSNADGALRRNRPPGFALGVVPTLVLATGALVGIVFLMDWLLLVL